MSEHKKYTDDVLDTAQVAAMLSVDRQTIARYRDDHGLPAHRVTAGSKWLYIKSDVLDWLRNRCFANTPANGTILADEHARNAAIAACAQ